MDGDTVGRAIMEMMGPQEGTTDDEFRKHIEKCLKTANDQFKIIIRCLLLMGRKDKEEELILSWLNTFILDDVFDGDWLDYDGVRTEEK